MRKQLFETKEPLCVSFDNYVSFKKPVGEMNELELNEVSVYLADYYARKGLHSFMSQGMTDEKIRKTVQNLDQLSIDSMVENSEKNNLNYNVTGTKLASSFHEHMTDIDCGTGSKVSPLRVYSNKEKFIRAIKMYLIVMSKNQEVFSIGDSHLINILRTSSRAQMVSNFKPSVAKYIYEKYGNKGIVLDPCAGYGGRLLGAWCSNIQKYVGVDPSTKTIEGNRNLYKKLSELTEYKSLFGIHRPKIELHQLPFEDFETTEKFDLVFTSPPYFNTEKYSHEDTQSWVRYKTYPAWLKGFLEPLVRKSHEYLKSGGYFVINTKESKSDFKDKKIDMYADTLKIAETFFGKPIRVEYMPLSLFIFLQKKDLYTKKEHTYKFEPIAIFRKT